MTKRGRTNGALDAINSQRTVRAALVVQRQHEAGVLTNLKTEQAAAAAKAHQVEVEAALIMYVSQLLGGTTEQAIRWLILVMVPVLRSVGDGADRRDSVRRGFVATINPAGRKAPLSSAAKVIPYSLQTHAGMDC